MCNPIAIGLGALQATSSYIGQQQAASAQARSQAQASKAEQERARQANISLRLREAQENIARSQRTEAAQLEEMEARSRARLVALTEVGVGGQALTSVIDSLKAKEARYTFSEERQKQFQAQQRDLTLQEEAVRTNMNQLRINQPIQQASLLSAGLSGIQTGLSSAPITKDIDFFKDKS